MFTVPRTLSPRTGSARISLVHTNRSQKGSRLPSEGRRALRGYEYEDPLNAEARWVCERVDNA